MQRARIVDVFTYLYKAQLVNVIILAKLVAGMDKSIDFMMQKRNFSYIN